MKKNLLFVFLLLLLSCPIITNAVATNASEDLNYVNIQVFVKDDCDECDKATKWVNDYLKDDKRVTLTEINTKNNKDTYDKVKDALNVKKDDLPLIVIGSNYFLGFDKKTEENLNEAIKSYVDSKDHCNIADKLDNKDELDKCLKINEGIYKEPSEDINMVMIILIIIIVIAAIFGVMFFLKNDDPKTSK